MHLQSKSSREIAPPPPGPCRMHVSTYMMALDRSLVWGLGMVALFVQSMFLSVNHGPGLRMAADRGRHSTG